MADGSRTSVSVSVSIGMGMGKGISRLEEQAGNQKTGGTAAAGPQEQEQGSGSTNLSRSMS